MSEFGPRTSPDSAGRGERDVTVFRHGAHAAAIRDIADTVGRPVAEVALLYREIFVAMEARAAITAYLPILVSRKIRDRYRDLS